LSTPNTGKRLTATDWATIVTLAERGEKNLRELAEQFGVSQQAISKGLKARGVTIGSRITEVMSEVDDVARKERERRVKQANVAVEQYAKYYDALTKRLIKTVLIDGTQTAGGVAAANAEVLSIKNTLTALRIAREESWNILKIEELLGEHAELPDLNVGEYTPDEIEAIRQANEEHYLEGQEGDGEGDEDDAILSEIEDEDED
jgi:predicted DNA binding protein